MTQTLSIPAMIALHSATLPATLTPDAIDGLQPFGGDSLPMTDRESALRPDETHGTFYAPNGRVVCTLTRPRLYGDAAGAEPGAAGLFRVHLTDGRLVYASARVPTLAGLRKALGAYLRPVDCTTVSESSDAQCKAEIASATDSIAANLSAATDSQFDHFRASALTRAARAARKAAIWRAALCDGCQTCDGAGTVRKAPGYETACPNCQPEPSPRSIDLTPTWAGLMPGLIAALQNGTAQGQAMAQAELMRLAAQVDRINAQARADAESIGAARNPATIEERAPRAAHGQGGGFPLWACHAIEESRRLDIDLADPFGAGWCDQERDFGPDGSGFWGAA